MAKCVTCNKEIRNIYKLDNKIYGYTCYRKALALKYINLQQEKNKTWNLQAASVIEIYKNKKFSKKWNLDFQSSILEQFNNFKKLSGRQLECILKSFTDLEYFSFKLLNWELDSENKELEKWLFNSLRSGSKSSYYLENFKNNDSVKAVINSYARNNTCNRKYCIITTIDEYKDVYCRLKNTDKKDKYIKEAKKDKEEIEIIEL